MNIIPGSNDCDVSLSEFLSLDRDIDARKATCYYPGCETDLEPIMVLGGHCDTFLYVDDNVTMDVFAAEINKGFHGVTELASFDADLANNYPEFKFWMIKSGKQTLKIGFRNGDGTKIYEELFVKHLTVPDVLCLIQLGPRSVVEYGSIDTYFETLAKSSKVSNSLLHGYLHFASNTEFDTRISPLDGFSQRVLYFETKQHELAWFVAES